ncbi:hypothetical protein FSP39_010246 [Pinctada imbricata]|uniref:Uncharacterized protein n=1 Tax=Pinctada imbricata TaxID=66713 RepID=A0AA88XNU8_PINIB|nr:hypothetical protein FSP39_010246 [Pinctada imbricata]
MDFQRFVTFLYHLIVFSIWSASLYYDIQFSVFSPEDTTLTYRGYGGKFKYLTFWNFVRDIETNPGPDALNIDLSIQSKNLSLCHINPQSILNKVDLIALELSKFDIITVSETCNVDDSCATLPSSIPPPVSLSILSISSQDVEDALIGINTGKASGPDLIIQTLYFGVSLANDICGSNVRPSHKGQQRSKLQTWRDNMLATVVFPVGTFTVLTFWGIYAVDRDLVHPRDLDAIVPNWLNHMQFVVLTFWGIYAVDRELVYPKKLDKIIPPWLNHVMHTTVLPFLLVDKFLVYHQYPSKKNGITTLMSFAGIYLAWILWIAYHANIWVYPILRVMTPVQRAVFIVLLLGFFISIYIVGEALNKFLWRKERAVLQKEKKMS